MSEASNPIESSGMIPAHLRAIVNDFIDYEGLVLGIVFSVSQIKWLQEYAVRILEQRTSLEAQNLEALLSQYQIIKAENFTVRDEWRLQNQGPYIKALLSREDELSRTLIQWVRDAVKTIAPGSTPLAQDVAESFAELLVLATSLSEGKEPGGKPEQVVDKIIARLVENYGSFPPDQQKEMAYCPVLLSECRRILPTLPSDELRKIGLKLSAYFGLDVGKASPSDRLQDSTQTVGISFDEMIQELSAADERSRASNETLMPLTKEKQSVPQSKIPNLVSSPKDRPCNECRFNRNGRSIARATLDAFLPAFRPKIEDVFQPQVEQESKDEPLFVTERDALKISRSFRLKRPPLRPGHAYCGVDEFLGKYYLGVVKNDSTDDFEYGCQDFKPIESSSQIHSCATCKHHIPPSSLAYQTLDRSDLNEKVKDLIEGALDNQARFEFKGCVVGLGHVSGRPGFLPRCSLPQDSAPGNNAFIIGPVVNAGNTCEKWELRVDHDPMNADTEISELIAKVLLAEAEKDDYYKTHTFTIRSEEAMAHFHNAFQHAKLDVTEACLLSLGVNADIVDSICEKALQKYTSNLLTFLKAGMLSPSRNEWKALDADNWCLRVKGILYILFNTPNSLVPIITSIQGLLNPLGAGPIHSGSDIKGQAGIVFAEINFSWAKILGDGYMSVVRWSLIRSGHMSAVVDLSKSNVPIGIDHEILLNQYFRDQIYPLLQQFINSKND